MTTVQLTARNSPKVKHAPQVAAAALKQIRMAHGMSQPVFARVLDVSPETLKGWEQGRKRPRGPVRRLLQVMERHPDIVEEMTRELAPSSRRTDPFTHVKRPESAADRRDDSSAL